MQAGDGHDLSLYTRQKFTGTRAPGHARLRGWQVPGAASISSTRSCCQPEMAASVDTLLDRILGSLLPPRCVLCSGRGQRPCLDLCADCQAELPVVARACLGCGLARPTSPDQDPPDPGEPLRGGTACLACRQHPPPYDRCFAACSYAHPVDALVQALKYGDQLAVGRVLGEVLARGIEAFGLHLDVDCLLPVPLHPRRLAERGYNQSA